MVAFNKNQKIILHNFMLYTPYQKNASLIMVRKIQVNIFSELIQPVPILSIHLCVFSLTVAEWTNLLCCPKAEYGGQANLHATPCVLGAGHSVSGRSQCSDWDHRKGSLHRLLCAHVRTNYTTNTHHMFYIISELLIKKLIIYDQFR